MLHSKWTENTFASHRIEQHDCSCSAYILPHFSDLYSSTDRKMKKQKTTPFPATQSGMEVSLTISLTSNSASRWSKLTLHSDWAGVWEKVGLNFSLGLHTSITLCMDTTRPAPELPSRRNCLKVCDIVSLVQCIGFRLQQHGRPPGATVQNSYEQWRRPVTSNEPITSVQTPQ